MLCLIHCRILKENDKNVEWYFSSDLTDPPNWYPEAREMDRKIIFHAGPTNSGKTYHALERFMNAKSGIYCGPLKLLAVEVICIYLFARFKVVCVNLN